MTVLLTQVVDASSFFEGESDPALKRNHDVRAVKADQRTVTLFKEWLVKNAFQGDVCFWRVDIGFRFSLLDQKDSWVIVEVDENTPKNVCSFTSAYHAMRYLKGLLSSE